MITDYEIAHIGDKWRVFNNHNGEIMWQQFDNYNDAESYAEAWLVDKGY